MKLYHGTSARHLDAILRDGIQPRGRRQGNWPNAPSRRDGVYLTDCYAPHFAWKCAIASKDGALIVEIETDRLNPLDFVPDEDALEQAGRGHDKIKGDLLKRVAWYRNNLENWANGEFWLRSLEAMGTCCHLGIIPPTAITRHAACNWKDAIKLSSHWDASICLMNYCFVGSDYKRMTAMLFGDAVPPPEPDSLETMRRSLAKKLGVDLPDNPFTFMEVRNLNP